MKKMGLSMEKDSSVIMEEAINSWSYFKKIIKDERSPITSVPSLVRTAWDVPISLNT
jgi:hypothetical protein